jgi:2-polyprenyl-3-methyl-5-hydroxy-6-metoxy-1,4-benzoquinol methylase
MQVENQLKNQIEEAKKLLSAVKEKVEARILYENCPLCKSDKIIKSVVGDCSKQRLYNPIIPKKMQWMDCEDCHHQFINGHFTDEALEVIFSQQPEEQVVGFEVEKQRPVSARIIEKIIPFKSNGIWMDVGFGNGSLLFTADEYGFEPIGVDLRKDGVLRLQNLGIQAHSELVQNIEFEKSISVVSMMDVLEHIPFPKDVLISLHSKMDEDGCLLISCPNSESWIWKLMASQNINPYFNTIEHYHNFSKTRLVSLLNECGFNIKKYGISERYRSGMEIIAQKY